MIFGMTNVIKREGGYRWKVVLINLRGVRSESWVTNVDVLWLLSGDVFAVDTVDLCK